MFGWVSPHFSLLNPLQSELLQDICGVRRTPLPKNNSLPNLRKHDTEAMIRICKAQWVIFTGNVWVFFAFIMFYPCLSEDGDL
jgi:hypothetical protein